MGRFVIPSAVEEWSGLGSRDIDGQAVGRMSGEANESVSDYSSPV